MRSLRLPLTLLLALLYGGGCCPLLCALERSEHAGGVARQSSYAVYTVMACVKQVAQGVYTLRSRAQQHRARAARRVALTEFLLAGWLLTDLLFSYLLPYCFQRSCQQPQRYTYHLHARHIAFKLLLLVAALLGGAGVAGYQAGPLIGVLGVVGTQLLLTMLLVGNSRSNQTRDLFDAPNYCSSDFDLIEKYRTYPATTAAHHRFFERLYNTVAITKVLVQSGLLVGWFFLGDHLLPLLVVAGCLSAELFLAIILGVDLLLRTQYPFVQPSARKRRWLCWQLHSDFLGDGMRLKRKNILVAILKAVMGLVALWAVGVLYETIKKEKRLPGAKNGFLRYALVLLQLNSVGLLLMGFLENLENYRCCHRAKRKAAPPPELTTPLENPTPPTDGTALPYPFEDNSLSLDLFTEEEQATPPEIMMKIKSTSITTTEQQPTQRQVQKSLHYHI